MNWWTEAERDPPASAGSRRRRRPSTCMPRPLKIVHLIHSGAIGGGPQVVLDLATSVAAFHTIVVPDDGPLLSDAARQGIETVRLEFAGKVSFGLSLPRLVWMFRRADVVHL